MVTEYGMSDEIGAINYDGGKRPRFLDARRWAGARDLWRGNAKKIDAEISRLLSDAHSKARKILGDYSPAARSRSRASSSP